MVKRPMPGLRPVDQREVTVGVRGVGLRCRVTGTGPPFVWAHALLSSMAHEDATGVFDWTGLARTTQVVRYDARGHGESAGSQDPADYEWPSLARDLLGLADRLGLERFAAGGVSMGCGTALWAAVGARARIERLVLALPPTGWETRPRQQRAYRVAGALARMRLMAPLYPVVRNLPAWGTREGTRDAYLRTAASFATRIDPATMATILRGASDTDMPPEELLAEITCPALILAWRHDTSHPLATAEALSVVLPGARLHVAERDRDVAAWPELVAEFLSPSPSPNGDGAHGRGKRPGPEGGTRG